MRITNSLLAQIAQRRTAQGQSNILDATQRLTARSAVESPVDDPVAAGRIQRVSTYQSQLDTMSHSRSIVRNDLNTAEVALGSMSDLVVRAQELAIQLGNDTMGADNRANGAIEVQALFEQLQGIANQPQSGGKFLFGGTQDRTPPLDDAGRYQGDLNLREVEIGPGQTMAATLNGADVFGPNSEVLNAFESLRSALETNDVDGIRASIDGLGQARETVGRAWTDVGSRLATIDSVESMNEDLMLALDLEFAELTEVDFAAGASDLAIAQTALQAVVQTSRSLLERANASWLR